MAGLVLLFVGSGCAALIYEIVWFHFLQLVIGSSALSLGVLLGTFMGGMCAGSLLLPRLIARHHHPLRVYALLEIVIGMAGLTLWAAMPLVSSVYGALGGGHLVLRLGAAGACLLLPTMAMGATLPAVGGSVELTPGGASRVGWLYAGNLIGAVIGTVVAGFYLLRVFDVAIATYVAATINAIVAIAAWTMSLRKIHGAAPPPPVAVASTTAPGTTLVQVTIGLSGVTALSAQVLWTRLLALHFGATVYAFSLILAVVLTGLGVGSAIGALLARSYRTNHRTTLGWCQVMLAGALAWSGYLLTEVMPYWPVDASIAANPWLTLTHDAYRAVLVVFPGALLWGASFPLALASVSTGRDARRVVAGLYASNTIGGILGALATSLVLVGTLGSQRTLQLLIGVAGVAGLLALLSATSVRRIRLPFLEWTVVIVCVTVLATNVGAVPAALIAHGRRAEAWMATARVADIGSILYAEEGVNDFIAVSRGADDELYYHASGKVQASTVPEDMRLQLLLAHLSHLVPRRASKTLVIGCGAGITAGALSLGPGVENIVIAEIEPLATHVASRYFGPYNHRILSDPRVSLRIDDGRHILATTNETFDVITTDLIDPWVKGVASLFTREFFALARTRLRPGGVVTQFVQLYQSSPEAVRSEIATFVEVFPEATVWGNPHQGQGYDLVLLGQVEPASIDVDLLQGRLDSPEYRQVANSLRTIGVHSAVDLLATYAGSGQDLTAWLQGAPINRDRNLRLQYLAGLGLNMEENGPIYRDMLRHARFPPERFTGSPESLAALRAAIERNLAHGRD